MFKRKFITLLVSLLIALLGLCHAAYADDTNWQWPVSGAAINGYKLDSYYEAGQHRGIDIQAKEGDDVFAPADGVIKNVGNAFGKGMYITIDHGDMISTYNGLGKVLVSKNMEIKAGEPIGKINAKGFHEALGTSHLHFAVYRESSGSQRQYVDPAQLLPEAEPNQDQTDAQETEPSPVTAPETQEIASYLQAANESVPNDPAHSNENIASTKHTKNHSETLPSADGAFNKSSKRSVNPAFKRSRSSKLPSLKPRQNNFPDNIKERVNVNNRTAISKNNKIVQVPGNRTRIDLFRRNKSNEPLESMVRLTPEKGKAGKDLSQSSSSINISDNMKNAKKASSFFPYQHRPRKLPWKVVMLIASLSLIGTINRDRNIHQLILTRAKKSAAYLFAAGPNLKTLPLAVAKYTFRPSMTALP